MLAKRFFAVSLIAFWMAPVLVAQSSYGISAGKILIASEQLQDRNFVQSVILLVNVDEDAGVLGLILNRQTEVDLPRIFPALKNVRPDPVYAGGPVGLDLAQALLRTSTKDEHATRVIEGVYATGQRELIEKSLGARMEPSKFRVYIGYAGWAPMQLQTEMRAGAWTMLPATPSIVFDNDPDSLWTRLTRQANSRIARLFLLPASFVLVR
jgi:putative transcriptional regulator